VCHPRGGGVFRYNEDVCEGSVVCPACKVQFTPRSLFLSGDVMNQIPTNSLSDSEIYVYQWCADIRSFTIGDSGLDRGNRHLCHNIPFAAPKESYAKAVDDYFVQFGAKGVEQPLFAMLVMDVYKNIPIPRDQKSKKEFEQESCDGAVRSTVKPPPPLFVSAATIVKVRVNFALSEF
jgi:hypothetical protein